MKFLMLLLSIQLASADQLSMTKKNLQGQKWLFEEGWQIIVSPVKAWDMAIQNNESSQEAFKKALSKIKASESSSKERLNSASQTLKDINQLADENSKSLFHSASAMKKKAFQQSSEDFQKAWKTLSLGYIQYGKRNAEDLESLRKINTEFFGRVEKDFDSMEKGIRPILGFLLEKEAVNWSEHFQEGSHAFLENYEKSGMRANTLMGLWDILKGYASWTYNAIMRPAGKATYETTKALPYYTTGVVLKMFITTHHTVHSLGANLYYSTKLGYGVVSPTLKSGYLASLALVEGVHGAVTPNVLRSAGLINKIALKGSAPLVGGAKFTLEESSARAQRAGTYLVHGTEAVGEVLLEKVESGVILGYSALSQIPPQLLLTAMNSAIFLVYDGPNLILAKVSGKVGDRSIEDIPSGSIMNMELMKKFGFKVEKLTDDPEILKRVLENAP